MSEQDSTPTPAAPPSASPAGSEPIAGEGAALPTGQAGSQPIAGEGTTYSQKSLDPIAGETTNFVCHGPINVMVVGEQTRELREAEVPGERTTDVPLAENPSRD